MQYVGEGAEEIYQESINELKENKDDVTEILIQDYFDTTEDNYLRRQQLIETMRALHSRKSIPLFSNLLMEKFPDEKAQDLHHGSTQLEEGIIRLTAIEGLGYFAKKERDEEVLITLLEVIKNNKSPLPLKRQATREYLQSIKNINSLEKNKELIRSFLPKSEHFIVTEKVDRPDEQLPDTKSPQLHEVRDHQHEHGHHHLHNEAPKI
jgi:hypothetical protein